MDPFLINPIDLMPFIGVPQNDGAKKKKLIKMLQFEADKQLADGKPEEYAKTMEQIKALQSEDDNQ